MAQFIGTVSCVSASDSAGFTRLQDSAGNSETFILWFGTSIPSELTAFTRVLHSMWISLLREAMAHNLTVKVIHPSGLANVTTVQLGT